MSRQASSSSFDEKDMINDICNELKILSNLFLFFSFSPHSSPFENKYYIICGRQASRPIASNIFQTFSYSEWSKLLGQSYIEVGFSRRHTRNVSFSFFFFHFQKTKTGKIAFEGSSRNEKKVYAHTRCSVFR